MKKEPIRWRVLSYDGEVALLLSENIILLRTATHWVSDFKKEAFTNDELKCIQKKEEKEEKIFLLSLEEVKNNEYGFFEVGEEKVSRKCDFTKFILDKINSMSKEEQRSMYESYWWLSSEGKDFYSYRNNMGEMEKGFKETQYYVDSIGEVEMTSDKDDSMGIRPAIYLDLSNETIWNYAGTTSTEDYFEIEYK